MKTFKLCTLAYCPETEEEKDKSFTLSEGLIINKENEEKNWLIDALMDEEARSFFEGLQRQQNSFIVKATITNEQNPPVRFNASVRSIKKMEQSAHIMLDALHIQRNI